ncbi:MAG: hypothetical protein QF561_07675 [Phycisphaerales bacterium]|jgi:hypothetical protein|nr:hypothetical protein [Phycisphaerales bacterium]
MTLLRKEENEAWTDRHPHKADAGGLDRVPENPAQWTANPLLFQTSLPAGPPKRTDAIVFLE